MKYCRTTIVQLAIMCIVAVLLAYIIPVIVLGLCSPKNIEINGTCFFFTYSFFEPVSNFIVIWLIDIGAIKGGFAEGDASHQIFGIITPVVFWYAYGAILIFAAHKNNRLFAVVLLFIYLLNVSAIIAGNYIAKNSSDQGLNVIQLKPCEVVLLLLYAAIPLAYIAWMNSVRRVRH